MYPSEEAWMSPEMQASGTALMPQAEEAVESSLGETEDENMLTAALQLSINGTPVKVKWENNQAVEELNTFAEREGIHVQASAYGGFEQVGPLPTRFSRNDVQMTAQAGDIVLYAGDQIVLFFGSNAWSYTKLGHMENLSERELTDLLDQASVTIEIAVN